MVIQMVSRVENQSRLCCHHRMRWVMERSVQNLKRASATSAGKSLQKNTAFPG